MEPTFLKIDRPVALIILDGWGYAPRSDGNAIAIAHTPFYDEICRSYPMTTLVAAGGAIGQDDDQPGSSELGHLNLGTGRIAQTETARLKQAVRSGEFLENKVFERAFAKGKAEGSAVHLIGLISDAGVHSSTENLFAILRLAKQHKLDQVFIHCILDGLDVPPRTADVYVEALEIKLADIGLGEIATLCGRYFAMDSGEHWERTARAFTMLVHAEGERSRDAVSSIRNSFLRGISDEFIAPIIIETSAGKPVATVKNGDLIVFFNHRPENMRQLTRSLCIPESAGMAKPVVETVCLTEYDAAFNLPAAFRHEPEKNGLSEILAGLRIPNIKITEQSRLPHVTHFFDGGADADHQQVIVPNGGSRFESGSESQSFKVADKFRGALRLSPNGVFVVNLPAADLAGATGDFARTVAAIQYVDTCLGGICDALRACGGAALITSAHANCEEMVHVEGGEPNSLPTANPVPLHYIDYSAMAVRLAEGSLQDVAPTILGVLGIEKPAEMTGTDLRVL